MKQKEAMFANFILKFGDHDLIDYLNEIVVRAFTDDALVSNRRGSSFYFLDVQLMELTRGEGNWVIAGRFVQDTMLRRTQVYREGQGLVHDEATLQSCPSSFFVLTLEDHRLIYFAETAYAPPISSFRATIANFINRKYRAFVDREYALLNNAEVQTSRRAIAEVHPQPSLSIIALTNREGIEEFLARYSVIRKLEIVVHKPNREIDGADAVANLQALRRQLGGDKGKFSVSEADGLNPEGTREVLEDVTDSPNIDTSVSGLDQEGDKLEGSNEDFSVRADIDLPQLETPNMARRLFAKMQELRDRGVLRLPDPDPQVRRRVEQIVNGLE
jgi:hypothetical protein